MLEQLELCPSPAISRNRFLRRGNCCLAMPVAVGLRVSRIADFKVTRVKFTNFLQRIDQKLRFLAGHYRKAVVNVFVPEWFAGLSALLDEIFMALQSLLNFLIGDGLDLPARRTNHVGKSRMEFIADTVPGSRRCRPAGGPGPQKRVHHGVAFDGKHVDQAVGEF